MHELLLAVAYAEAGEVDRPRAMLGKAPHTPVGARTMAVLSATPDEAWRWYAHSWNLTTAGPPSVEPAEVTSRLVRNVADEMLQFLVGQLPGAASGHADTTSVWFVRLRAMSDSAAAAASDTSDTQLLVQAMLSAAEGEYGAAMGVLGGNCFPTLGRGRDVLISLWRACAEGRVAKAKGAALTPVEARRARAAAPVPRSIGCPYATLYCEQYW